ncbi:TRAP transporter substrate-binding protein [Propioniciclava coleopterorum]|uniref:TRAP transporter substrate-binding protein n=1 Tax=Propioniciclava coleopterorum TaxID=2714937 RepID=A0A6G7Y7V6_9ACTN|nr:TRAP transporter substrate-binding protein [Propioniciclava coleopterorum]QIK72711.1 TRAP transporter substrate-binding protein [Propioniciclava coleopterorum]
MQAKKIAAAVVAGITALALSACGSPAGGGGTGGGEKTTFRLAFNQTEAHPQFKAAEELGKKLEQATDGRYTIEVFANETLGSQNEVVQQVSDGTVDMMYIGGPVMESFNQDFIVFNLPYVFDSPEAQAKVFADEAVMGDLKKSIEGSKKITVLGALHAGVRNVYNAKKPVTSPADLAGMKIRVQQSDSQVKMIQDMGGVASPMGQGDVYSALQTGVLDGAENNETVFNALKHDEVAKYYSYTRHLMIPDYLLMSTEVLNKMDEKDRTALLELIPETIDAANKGFMEFVEESKAASEKTGAKFNDDVDTSAFKAATESLVKASINNPVRQKLYDAVQKANG